MQKLAAKELDQWLNDEVGTLAYVILSDPIAKAISPDYEVLSSQHAVPIAKQVLASKKRFEAYKNVEQMVFLRALQHSDKITDVSACEQAAEKCARRMRAAGITQMADMFTELVKLAREDQKTMRKFKRVKSVVNLSQSMYSAESHRSKSRGAVQPVRKRK